MSKTERWIVALIAFIFCALYGGSLAAGSAENTKVQDCQNKLFDHYVIADALINRGSTREGLIAAAQNSPMLPDERRAEAMRLVIEATEAPDVKAWFRHYWDTCMGEDT